MGKQKPEERALRATLREWLLAVEEEEYVNGEFVRDALTAVLEGMVNLEERMTHALKTDWKNGAIIAGFQNELNLMRYKMINLSGENNEKQ